MRLVVKSRRFRRIEKVVIVVCVGLEIRFKFRLIIWLGAERGVHVVRILCPPESFQYLPFSLSPRLAKGTKKGERAWPPIKKGGGEGLVARGHVRDAVLELVRPP